MTAVEQTGINTKLDVKVSFCKVHVSEILFLLPHQCVLEVTTHKKKLFIKQQIRLVNK